jgi:hypothetical protein
VFASAPRQESAKWVQDSVCEILFGTLFGGVDFHNCRRVTVGESFPRHPK